MKEGHYQISNIPIDYKYYTIDFGEKYYLLDVARMRLYKMRKGDTYQMNEFANSMQKTSIFRGKPITLLYFEAEPNSMEQIDDNEAEVKGRHWNIKPGDIILDIGAAFGSYTLTALSQGAEKVIAWEPTISNFLAKNIAINKWQDRCVVINQALWSKQGYIKTSLSKSVVPKFTEIISQNDCRCTGEYGNVQSDCFMPCDTLDNSIAVNEPHIDVIKIDVEGAEFEVLKGGEKLLRKFKPDVLIENHLFLDNFLYDKCRNFMFDLGYKEILSIPYHGVSHSFYSFNDAQTQRQ